ncbi:MAG: DUF559 domain-containing protein [Ilumatobacteraceae bacterium]
MRLSSFDDWARSHHGILSLHQCDLSRSSWYRAIESGQIEQIHPGVARMHGTSDTPEQRIIAGVLAVGDGALASHRSAARLWGLPRPDQDPVDVILAGSTRHPRLEGVEIHRPTDRGRLIPQRRYGIPCTNVLRTLVDLGAVDPDGVSDAVGHAVTNDLASLSAIETAAAEHARRGRGGTVALRDAVDDWSIDAKPADSLLESALHRLIQRHDLPPVEFHPTIEGYEVDFRVIDAPVVIECDGWAHHGRERTQFERDHERDSRLIGAGWIVLRFTYRAITTRPSATADRIRDAVARWDPTAPDAA